MNSSRNSNLVIAGAVGLVVIALVVRTLRPKHASGAGTAAPPDVMVGPESAFTNPSNVPIHSP